MGVGGYYARPMQPGVVWWYRVILWGGRPSNDHQTLAA